MAITRAGSSGFAARPQGSFAGKGVVVDVFLPETGPTTGKKPGIPADAPAWLKTMLEILTGRRGNQIAIPAPRVLTFSAVPTKEECEALYALVNEVRDTQAKIITRFDS
jgi:hypothetical protein